MSPLAPPDLTIGCANYITNTIVDASTRDPITTATPTATLLRRREATDPTPSPTDHAIFKDWIAVSGVNPITLTHVANGKYAGTLVVPATLAPDAAYRLLIADSNLNYLRPLAVIARLWEGRT